MQSKRCLGETKFFRQCPLYIAVKEDDPCFCWEHADQSQKRIDEINQQKRDGEVTDWAPLGAYVTNRLPAKPEIIRRMKDLAEDEQNVHTSEVQVGVNGAIKRLKQWALDNGIKLCKDLATEIEKSFNGWEPLDIEKEAIEHMRHCYQWNDDTKMFGVTYPLLATWVWARVNREHENREILRDRFFEEVRESIGQCLNGNMARLMNTFAAIDLEMSPQEMTLGREQLQNLIAKSVREQDMKEALVTVNDLLKRANISTEECEEWIQCVKESYD